MIALVLQLAWVSGARIASLALWLAGLIAIYRWFGTVDGGLAEAGAFALALAMIKAVTSCIGDAVDLQTMRGVPLALRDDPPRGNEMWQAAVVLRLAAGVIAAAALAALAPALAGALLGDEARAGLVRLTGVAVLAALGYRAAFSYLQAQQRFGPLIALEAGLQAGRLALIAVLLLTGSVSAESALLGYVLASGLAVVAAPLVLPRQALLPWRVVPGDCTAALRYTAWILPALFVSAITERADLFVLAALEGPEVAGLYGAVLPLALAPDMVGAFLAGVLQPKVARMRADGVYRAHARALTALFVPAALVAAVGVVALRHEAILWTVGEAYLPVADAFAILAVGTLSWLALTPLALSSVVLSRPRTTLVVSIGQAAYIGAVGIPLVASHGVVGAAIAIASMRLLVAALLWAIAWADAAPAPLALRPAVAR